MTWVEDELKTQDEQRTEALAQAGRTPFYSAPKGESIITIDKTKEPETRTSKFGKDQKAFAITANDNDGKPAEFTFTVTINSPMYRDLLNILKNSASNPVKIKLIRTGVGQQTRYDISEA